MDDRLSGSAPTSQYRRVHSLNVEATLLLGLAAAPSRRGRSLAGKTAWVCSFVLAVGSMIAPLWAAIADCKKCLNLSKSNAMLAPREPSIPIVRLRHSLKWIVVFSSGVRGTLLRELDVWTSMYLPGVMVVCWCGLDRLGPTYFALPIQGEDISRFDIVIGDPAFQALVENIAILIGVCLWLPHWRSERLVVRIRDDSIAALGAWEKEHSSNPAVNMVVREMALDLAEGKYKIDFKQHLPGDDRTALERCC